MDFVQCTGCSLVLVYKSKTGTASLLRHRCAKFPISVYDLKLAAAGHPIDLLNSMDNSSGNSETIEMKQEMLSDDECLDLQDIHDDNDQQFTNDQTNKGLMVSFSLLERSLVTGDDSLLTREEIVAAQRTNDPELYFERFGIYIFNMFVRAPQLNFRSCVHIFLDPEIIVTRVHGIDSKSFSTGISVRILPSASRATQSCHIRKQLVRRRSFDTNVKAHATISKLSSILSISSHSSIP